CPVPNSAYPNIQAAVNDVTCDTINVAAGTYFENVVINRDVTIRGEGQESTIVDGGGNGGGFEIGSDTVTIKGMTIQHGNGLGPSDGGILNHGTLAVQNSMIDSNFANSEGGGIANFDTLIVQNSTISNNTAFFIGGGIANFGTLIVQNSTISNNTAFF